MNQELRDQKRMLATTVKIKNFSLMLPVGSSLPIQKNKIMDVINYLNNLEVVLPINYQDIIVKNILSLDVDIIASRSLK